MRDLHHGVVQGSVLGPLHFLLYTFPLADIIHSFRYCADNSQSYMTFKPFKTLFLPKGEVRIVFKALFPGCLQTCLN